MRVLVINPVGDGPRALEFLYTDINRRSVHFHRCKARSPAVQWRHIHASVYAHKSELELVLVKSTPALDGSNICAAVRDVFPDMFCISVNPIPWDEEKNNIEMLFNFAKQVAEMMRT